MIIVERIGADPEVFLKNEKNQPISAIGRIGGTKAEPLQIDGFPDGFCIQEDNVAAEFNIPAANTPFVFDANINRMLGFLEKKAKKMKLKLAIEPALHFSDADLAHPKAQQLGCDPDFCVWTQSENPRPIPPKSLRTAAGHIHFGLNKPFTEQDVENVVKMCDMLLGVPSVLAFPKSERRELYGKAGAFRFKPYGVEYRVLDNYWIKNQKWRRHVGQVAFSVTQWAAKPGFLNLIDDMEDLIRDCIDNQREDLAVVLTNKYNLPVFPGE